MTEQEAQERAYAIMVATLPLSWIEPAGSDKGMTPKAVKMRNHLARCLLQVETETWERAAKLVEGGRFLHDEAPTAQFAREVAAALRRAGLQR